MNWQEKFLFIHRKLNLKAVLWLQNYIWIERKISFLNSEWKTYSPPQTIRLLIYLCWDFFIYSKDFTKSTLWWWVEASLSLSLILLSFIDFLLSHFCLVILLISFPSSRAFCKLSWKLIGRDQDISNDHKILRYSSVNSI